MGKFYMTDTLEEGLKFHQGVIRFQIIDKYFHGHSTKFYSQLLTLIEYSINQRSTFEIHTDFSGINGIVGKTRA